MFTKEYPQLLSVLVHSPYLLKLGIAGSNQSMIMNKGGARLLANVASKTGGPQTLRMVAGAVANLCGNGTTSCLYCYQPFNKL
jgi:hypothetical protein